VLELKKIEDIIKNSKAYNWFRLVKKGH